MSACGYCDSGDPSCKMCHPKFVRPWDRLEHAIWAFDKGNKFPLEQLLKLKPVGEAWRLIPAWTSGKVGLSCNARGV